MYTVCAGFLGKIAFVAERTSLLLAEAEVVRLRSEYPDKRVEFWVSNANVRSNLSWDKVRPILAKEGDLLPIFGLSSQKRAEDRAKIIVTQAIHRRLNGERLDTSIGDLPYTVDEVMAHIAKQFRPGMTWANWGEWHIDHIRPRSDFDLRDPKQFFACCALENLQPLWAAENIAKSVQEKRRASERARSVNQSCTSTFSATGRRT
jgi:hypothetical protein